MERCSDPQCSPRGAPDLPLSDQTLNRIKAILNPPKTGNRAERRKK